MLDPVLLMRAQGNKDQQHKYVHVYSYTFMPASNLAVLSV